MMITREKKDIYHNFLHRHMNLMLTISKELESLCKKFIPGYAEKIVTLYHGVKAPEKFLDEDNRMESRKTFNFGADDFVVGIIGRLEENKGQHLLINAISMAKQHDYNIKARIYLDVDLKNKLAAQGKQDADIRFNDTFHFQQLEKLFRSCIN